MQCNNNIDLYKMYDDIIYKTEPAIPNIKTCGCINNQIIPDQNNYYLVCTMCGLCIDYIKDYALGYCDYMNLRHSYTKREYKKTTYLRLKVSKLFRNKNPCLPDYHIDILKKKNSMNIKIIVKYMKKYKLIKTHDPIKSMYKIKSIVPIYISDLLLNKLIDEFKKKEIKYIQNGIKRINYNHTILKIFQEWKQTDMFLCFDLIQDKKIIEKHNLIYNRIFN